MAIGDFEMIPAHRIEAILSEDGRLLLDDLPFRAGQAVEIIVLPAAITVVAALAPHPLSGRVISFEGSLFIGRRENPDSTGMGEGFWVVRDRMVSSRHATIRRYAETSCLADSY